MLTSFGLNNKRRKWWLGRRDPYAASVVVERVPNIQVVAEHDVHILDGWCRRASSSARCQQYPAQGKDGHIDVVTKVYVLSSSTLKKSLLIF